MSRSGARTATRIAAIVGTLLIGVAGVVVATPAAERVPSSALAGAAGATRSIVDAAHRARPLTRGFADDVWFYGPQWTARTIATGTKLVLLEVDWASVEPTAPVPGSDPTSPSDSQYAFGPIDAVLRQFAGTGVAAGFEVSDAPRWAETPGGPAPLEADGAWRPDAAAYGQFATALARRYSGSYPDPLHAGRALPRVRYFQAWAEANINVHLSPQWTPSHGTWVPTAPGMYRSLLNAFYTGVKSVHADDLVLTSGFGPYGDLPGACVDQQTGNGCRMPPAMFVRELLCVHGKALSAESCPAPARFDVLAMDPYEVGSPTTPAANADDVSAPDLGKLARIVRRAVRLGRALPASHKQLWVTEFSYDSNPPNPTAVSTATQARWLEQSFYVFWSEGVNTVVWYLLRDQGGTNYATSYYSGVYFHGGAAKPSLEAYRFPFVVMASGNAVRAWGIAPRNGSVAVELKQDNRWRTLFRVNDSAGEVFVHEISPRLRGPFRAEVGGESSLVWRR